LENPYGAEQIIILIPNSLNNFLAWNDKRGETENQKGEVETKKGEFRTAFDILKDYAEYSTIQGVVYIFFEYQVSCNNNLTKR